MPGFSINYTSEERRMIRENLDRYGGYVGWAKASQAKQERDRVEKERLDELRRQGWHMAQELDLKPYRVVQAGDELIPIHLITGVNIADLADQRIIIKTAEGEFVSEGFHAIEALMVLKPSAMEGRRLRWRRNAWAWHNLVVHPVLQIMVWMGFKRQAVAFHDRFSPRPEGFRS
jgi:hypothetical protein